MHRNGDIGCLRFNQHLLTTFSHCRSSRSASTASCCSVESPRFDEQIMSRSDGDESSLNPLELSDQSRTQQSFNQPSDQQVTVNTVEQNTIDNVTREQSSIVSVPSEEVSEQMSFESVDAGQLSGEFQSHWNCSILSHFYSLS